MPRTLSFRDRLIQLPLFLLVFGVASASMLVPAVYAGVIRELEAQGEIFYVAKDG